MRKFILVLFSVVGLLAAGCGGNVCDDVQDKVNACFDQSACDDNAACAAAKANRTTTSVACEGLVKAAADACDQSKITPSSNCLCVVN